MCDSVRLMDSSRSRLSWMRPNSRSSAPSPPTPPGWPAHSSSAQSGQGRTRARPQRSAVQRLLAYHAPPLPAASCSSRSSSSLSLSGHSSRTSSPSSGARLRTCVALDPVTLLCRRVAIDDGRGLALCLLRAGGLVGLRARVGAARSQRRAGGRSGRVHPELPQRPGRICTCRWGRGLGGAADERPCDRQSRAKEAGRVAAGGAPATSSPWGACGDWPSGSSDDCPWGSTGCCARAERGTGMGCDTAASPAALTWPSTLRCFFGLFAPGVFAASEESAILRERVTP